MQKIAIVGYGQFSEFIVTHLVKNFEVTIFSSRDISPTPGVGEVRFVNYGESGWEENLKDLEYLILSVPLNGLENICKKFSPFVEEKTIICDVTSVKVKPVKLMKQYFLNNQILGTHPIFGPQSGKNGIEGLPFVITNVSVDEEKYEKIKTFLSEIYKLNIIEKTAEMHDREMAYVQGLSHFIGRALATMNISLYETATKSYKQLISLENLVGGDTWELYKTIQNGNELTKEVRTEFLKTLIELENKLEQN